MSLSHRAFIFDHHLFQRELRPMLEAALASGTLAPLRQFIKESLPYLKDPNEVHRNLTALCEASPGMPAELLPSLSSFIALLHNATEKRLGPYVTF